MNHEMVFSTDLIQSKQSLKMLNFVMEGMYRYMHCYNVTKVKLESKMGSSCSLDLKGEIAYNVQNTYYQLAPAN